MAQRVPRHVAKELIAYVKSIKVRANYEDPLAKSAFEFGRQMSSPKLVKINSQFECEVSMHTTPAAPLVEVELLDGSKLVMDTTGKKCADLRSELYEKASEAEEAIERKGGLAAVGGAGDKGGAKGGKAGDKGGGKKK